MRQDSPVHVDRQIFVVQRHEATALHFDLRLQVGEVLASWAVPKGPSLDPREKRLAKQVEDHALDHATFEGRIGRSRYGAGTVIVWDTGDYTNLTERNGVAVPMREAIDSGHLKVWLRGQKISGAFALTRTRMTGDDRSWIMVKLDDAGADRRRKPATTQLRSVLSGRTND